MPPLYHDELSGPPSAGEALLNGAERDAHVRMPQPAVAATHDHRACDANVDLAHVAFRNVL